MVTKFAGPFSDTCRCSISPRSRLRLRPAWRAAFTMTLIRAECSMMLRRCLDGDGALPLPWERVGVFGFGEVQAPSPGAEPVPGRRERRSGYADPRVKPEGRPSPRRGEVRPGLGAL